MSMALPVRGLEFFGYGIVSEINQIKDSHDFYVSVAHSTGSVRFRLDPHMASTIQGIDTACKIAGIVSANQFNTLQVAVRSFDSGVQMTEEQFEAGFKAFGKILCSDSYQSPDGICAATINGAGVCIRLAHISHADFQFLSVLQEKTAVEAILSSTISYNTFSKSYGQDWNLFNFKAVKRSPK